MPRLPAVAAYRRLAGPARHAASASIEPGKPTLRDGVVVNRVSRVLTVGDIASALRQRHSVPTEHSPLSEP